MITIQTTTARRWAQLLGLGLALAVAIVAILALVLPAAALTLALALVVAGATLALQQARAVARSARAAVAGAPSAAEAAQPTMLLELADGAVLSARLVPLPGDDAYTLVLTRQGYLLLGADGEVVHRL
jgi:hypothetical protein